MTRWLSLPIAAGLCACTSLNAAYDVGQDAGTDGAPTAPTTDRPTGPGGSPTASDGGATSNDNDTSTGASDDTSASGPSDPGDTADPTDAADGDETGGPGSTSGEDSTSGGGESSGGSGESTGGESTGGSTGDATQVVFVYATTASFAFLDDDPFVTCELAQPFEASIRCEGDGRVPLLETADTTFDEVLGDMDPHEVFGVLSDGTTPLAADPLAMLEGLNVSLTEGGVDIGPKEMFWTGTGVNCMNWSDDIKSDGTTGASSATDGSWFAAEDVACTENLQILCACLSIPNPFD